MRVPERAVCCEHPSPVQGTKILWESLLKVLRGKLELETGKTLMLLKPCRVKTPDLSAAGNLRCHISKTQDEPQQQR